MEYYSAIKRDEVVQFSETWMDQEIAYRMEVSQEREK